jgi:hypothetical protein
MLMFDRQRTDWQFAEPRLTSGAFGFLGSIARETSKLRWIATLVGLRLFRTRPILFEDRPRLEDVASGYWTLFIKQSSGLVSHYGSSLSYSARPLGARLLYVILIVFGKQRTYWHFAWPRLTSGAFDFYGPAVEWFCRS